MARILSSNFASIFTVEDFETIPEDPDPPRGITPLEIDSIRDQEVKKYLDKLDTNKSTGPDNLSPLLIKELKQQIFQPLTNIFNRSVQLNKVPEGWKMANVTPIFKGDKSVALNYSPISLTSVAGKVLEKIIRDKLVKSLEDDNIISDTQHDFRNKRSCLTNLLTYSKVYIRTGMNTSPVMLYTWTFRKSSTRYRTSDSLGNCTRRVRVLEPN